jgi:uncharacterized protein (TIGR02996 family)
MPDLPPLLDAIRADPDEGPRWLALAGWLDDNGRDDEAAAVRVYWPTLRDDLAAGVSLDETLAYVARHARRLGAEARKIEGLKWERSADD